MDKWTPDSPLLSFCEAAPLGSSQQPLPELLPPHLHVNILLQNGCHLIEKTLGYN